MKDIYDQIVIGIIKYNVVTKRFLISFSFCSSKTMGRLSTTIYNCQVTERQLYSDLEIQFFFWESCAGHNYSYCASEEQENMLEATQQDCRTEIMGLGFQISWSQIQGYLPDLNMPLKIGFCKQDIRKIVLKTSLTKWTTWNAAPPSTKAFANNSTTIKIPSFILIPLNY